MYEYYILAAFEKKQKNNSKLAELLIVALSIDTLAVLNLHV